MSVMRHFMRPVGWTCDDAVDFELLAAKANRLQCEAGAKYLQRQAQRLKEYEV